MNLHRTTVTTRVTAIVIAAVVNWALLNSIVAIAEPQRSVLLAKLQGIQQPALPAAVLTAAR